MSNVFGIQITEEEDSATLHVTGYDPNDPIPMGAFAKVTTQIITSVVEAYLTLFADDIGHNGTEEERKTAIANIQQDLFDTVSEMPLGIFIGLFEEAGQRDINPFTTMYSAMRSIIISKELSSADSNTTLS